MTILSASVILIIFCFGHFQLKLFGITLKYSVNYDQIMSLAIQF